MAELKLSDGNVILIKDGFMENAFQIELNSISEWENIESILNDSNLQNIEITENGNKIAIKNKHAKSFELHKENDGSYLVTVFIETLNNESIRLNSIEKSLNDCNNALEKIMKDLSVLILKY